jgi:dsDNA-specific endonuclease/ATPase MutS2
VFENGKTGPAPGARRAASAAEPEETDTAPLVEETGDASSHETPINLATTDTIDLHTFRPKDVPSVVAEFLNAASEAGITQVRIVHGKGIGVQRRIVREVLANDPRVTWFGDAPDASGWGATIARLHPGSTGTPTGASKATPKETPKEARDEA